MTSDDISRNDFGTRAPENIPIEFANKCLRSIRERRRAIQIFTRPLEYRKEASKKDFFSRMENVRFVEEYAKCSRAEKKMFLRRDFVKLNEYPFSA